MNQGTMATWQHSFKNWNGQRTENMFGSQFLPVPLYFYLERERERERERDVQLREKNNIMFQASSNSS